MFKVFKNSHLYFYLKTSNDPLLTNPQWERGVFYHTVKTGPSPVSLCERYGEKRRHHRRR